MVTIVPVLDADGGGLVGRDAELTLLHGVGQELVGGTGGVVWVQGEPGVGKSTLVAAGLSGLSRSGVRIFYGAADPWTQSSPLRLMIDCFKVGRQKSDPLRLDIADLLAGRGLAVDAVTAAGERLVALAERECAVAPVMLVADDVQWADEASLGVWHRLMSVATQEPLLLVAVSRPVPARDEVDRLRTRVGQHPGAVVLQLGPLSDERVADMVRARLLARPGPRLCAELDRASGNPLYVGEMVDILVKEGLIQVSGGSAEVTGPVGPDLGSLTSAVGSRLGFLSGETRHVLQAGAVLGGRFTIDELALVSGRTVPGLVTVANEAMAAGVLTGEGSELVFRHPLIKQVLHDELPAPVRVALHHHAAKTLAGAGEAWDRVARHLLAAPAAFDAWVLDWLAHIPAGALEALPALAADLLGRARRQCVPSDPQWALFTSRLTSALRFAGRREDVVKVAAEAVDVTADGPSRGEIVWNLARVYTVTGRLDDAAALITRVLGAANPGPPWRSRLRVLLAVVLNTARRTASAAASAVGTLWPPDAVRPEEWAAQAELARVEGEHDGDSLTLAWYWHFRSRNASDVDVLEFVDRALAILKPTDRDSVVMRATLLSNRLTGLSNLDRTSEFEAALAATAVFVDQVGAPGAGGVFGVAAEFSMDHGKWDEALLHLDHLVGVPEVGLDVVGAGMSAMIAMCRGDRSTAQRHIAEVADRVDPTDPYLVGYTYHLARAGALIAEEDGDLQTAVALLSTYLDPGLASDQAGLSARISVVPELLRLALRAGDARTAAAVMQSTEADATVSPSDRRTAIVNTCRGMLDDDPVPLEAAAEYYTAAGRSPDLAFVLQEAAVRYATRGDIDSARARFARAVAIYDELGADLDARRARARLRPYGIRSGPRSAHRKATTGWEALTAAERNVALLVAQGCSNPEIGSRLFVSRRTVGAHVAHILNKLDVRRRADIVREVIRRETVG